MRVIEVTYELGWYTFITLTCNLSVKHIKYQGKSDWQSEMNSLMYFEKQFKIAKHYYTVFPWNLTAPQVVAAFK